jgi:glucosamine--fructose-6-phosphate aminotransferase (isomerizing)
LAPKDKNYDKIKNAYMEVSSRNAPVILITENKNEELDNVINVESNKSYQQLLNVIPLQLFSYFLSINKGLDVDKPRNLAKCVTVL